MAAASRAVSTSGSAARALMEPARSRGVVGEVDGWACGRAPGSGVGGHWCSWAGGAVAGGGRSALPSAAGVGPYLDPAPGGGVFSLVRGLIVRLSASQAKWDRQGRLRARAHALAAAFAVHSGRNRLGRHRLRHPARALARPLHGGDLLSTVELASLA